MTTGALAEWRKGWPVVLGAGFGFGSGGGMVLLLAGLFIKPMKEALGWSTSAVTIAPIVTLVWALAYPFAGRIIDRIGSRSVAIIGAIGLAVCAGLLAIMPVSPAILYTLAAFIGLFASLTSVPTYARAVATWFGSGVGLALGITLSGSALVTTFALPFTGRMIADHGWRAGFLTIAGIIAFVGLPLILFFYREKPGTQALAGQPAASGLAMGEAVRDARFWGYLVAFSIACVPLGGFVGHLQPMLAQKGFALGTALSMGVLYGIAISVGKICAGLLFDRIWPFAVAAGITIVAGLGAVALSHVGAATPLPMLAVILFLIGTGQGAEADFIAFFTLRSFGMRAFASIVGVLAMMSTLGLAAGGFLFAQLADSDGTYDGACLIGAGCLIASGVVILLTGLVDRRTY
jgi:predicted MFS family arabinose efflux permease